MGVQFIFLVLALWMIWFLISSQRKRVKLLKSYGNRIDNIYVVSAHPDDDECWPLLGELNQVAIVVPYHDVADQCNEERRLLIKSQNKLFADGHLQILPIIFQDGEFINETWEQFTFRICEEIHNDRSKRHGQMKRADINWYMTNSNGQRNSFEWELKK